MYADYNIGLSLEERISRFRYSQRISSLSCLLWNQLPEDIMAILPIESHSDYTDFDNLFKKPGSNTVFARKQKKNEYRKLCNVEENEPSLI